MIGPAEYELREVYAEHAPGKAYSQEALDAARAEDAANARFNDARSLAATTVEYAYELALRDCPDTVIAALLREMLAELAGPERVRGVQPMPEGVFEGVDVSAPHYRCACELYWRAKFLQRGEIR